MTAETWREGRVAPYEAATPERSGPRVGFRFDGALDEVPTDAAVAFNDVARVLLRHCAEHRGRPATVRVARLGSLLNLWLSDPECSTSCLGGTEHLALIPTDPGPAAGGVRLFLDDEPGGGLRLHWALVLPRPQPAPATRARTTDNNRRERKIDDEPDEERPSYRLAAGELLEPGAGRHRIRRHVAQLLRG